MDDDQSASIAALQQLGLGDVAVKADVDLPKYLWKKLYAEIAYAWRTLRLIEKRSSTKPVQVQITLDDPPASMMQRQTHLIIAFKLWETEPRHRTADEWAFPRTYKYRLRIWLNPDLPEMTSFMQ